MQDATPLHSAVYADNLLEVQKLLICDIECNVASSKVLSNFNMVFLFSNTLIGRLPSAKSTIMQLVQSACFSSCMIFI